jgi:hypothetical protein
MEVKTMIREILSNEPAAVAAMLVMFLAALLV